jgi:hypothetical protein
MTKTVRDDDVFKWTQFIRQEEGKGVPAGVIATLAAFHNASKEKIVELQDENRTIRYGFNYVYDAGGQKREERVFEKEGDAAIFERNKTDRASMDNLESKFQSYMNALSHAPHDSQWHRNSADTMKDALKNFNTSPTRFRFNFSPATLTQAIDRLLADPKLFSEVQETVSPASTRRMEHRTPVWMEKLADIQPAAVVQKS